MAIWQFLKQPSLVPNGRVDTDYLIVYNMMKQLNENKIYYMYSETSLRQTPLGTRVNVRLREVSIL